MHDACWVLLRRVCATYAPLAAYPPPSAAGLAQGKREGAGTVRLGVLVDWLSWRIDPRRWLKL